LFKKIKINLIVLLINLRYVDVVVVMVVVPNKQTNKKQNKIQEKETKSF